MLDQQELNKMLTASTIKRVAADMLPELAVVLEKDGPTIFTDAEINTVERLSHFFAQCLKETYNLTRLDENLFYATAARLRTIFPSKFPNDASARPYLKNPYKLGCYVYAYKNGNGSVASGDGYAYRGSGMIQLTGRGNFQDVGHLIGVGEDLVNNPDIVRQAQTAVLIATGYWTVRKINDYANGTDARDVDAVTKLVNPYESKSGKKERQQNFDRVYPILQAAAARIQGGKSLTALTSRFGTRLDFGLGRPQQAQTQTEISTEPSTVDLRADMLADYDREKGSLPRTLALPAVYWPKDDKNSADYYHIRDETGGKAADEGYFTFEAEDLFVLAQAYSFRVNINNEYTAFGVRGATLGGEYEKIDVAAAQLKDVRPDHRNFRCTLGFIRRSSGRLHLFAGSTVPCPYYVVNHFNRENGLPSRSKIGCNLLPTGSYVFRVDAHDGGTIRPALRLSEPSNPSVDGAACVWRTTNDLAYGVKDQLDPPHKIYDNVHCSYFLSLSSRYDATFSSAGCLTVRGRKESTDQWKKYQEHLKRIGKGSPVSFTLITGKELAVVASLRASGASRASIISQLKRLRVGSSSPDVSALQGRLQIPATGYFDSVTQKAWFEFQRSNKHVSDGIYSPESDKATGWQVL